LVKAYKEEFKWEQKNILKLPFFGTWMVYIVFLQFRNFSKMLSTLHWEKWRMMGDNFWRLIDQLTKSLT
jgi:hypothetical protein